MFRLTFPQAGMLSADDYTMLSGLVASNADPSIIREEARKIQLRQNPNPAGQMELNTPWLDDEPFHGMQHKYRESVLFFPLEAQVCHAYCTYCFRWPQFSGVENLKFANDSIERLVEYLEQHPEVKDVIFTGGDPMVMSTMLIKKIHATAAWCFDAEKHPDRDQVAQLVAALEALCERQKKDIAFKLACYCRARQQRNDCFDWIGKE